MFAGIIQDVQPIMTAQKRGRNMRVRIKRPAPWRLKKGESINIDGICSTVADMGRGYFDVEYIPETLQKTTAASFTEGRSVNLERSLKVGESIDGHFVFGHVDARAEIRSVSKNGVREIDIAIPDSVTEYVVPLGSIAINGTSLTVARIRGGIASIALIPHTVKYTNLGDLKKGDMVNIEADMMARYAIAAARQSGRPREIRPKKAR